MYNLDIFDNQDRKVDGRRFDDYRELLDFIKDYLEIMEDEPITPMLRFEVSLTMR